MSEKDIIDTTGASIIVTEDPVPDALTQVLGVTPLSRHVIDGSSVLTSDQEKFHNNDPDGDESTSDPHNTEANDDLELENYVSEDLLEQCQDDKNYSSHAYDSKINHFWKVHSFLMFLPSTELQNPYHFHH